MATLYTDIADLRLAATLAAEIKLILADRSYLWRHPAIAFLGDQAASGSDSLKVPFVGYGMDPMQPILETGSTSDSPLQTSSVTLQVGRQALQRSVSDLAANTGTGVNVAALAAEAVDAAAGRFTQMVCNAGSTFSTVVGTSGSSYTVNNWFDAQFALQGAYNSGPAIAILYPKQWADLQTALRGEQSNMIAFSAPGGDRNLLDLKSAGYMGTFNGVDVYVSSHVPSANAGADSAGCMFSAGAIGYAEMSVNQVRAGSEVIQIGGSPIYCEIDRDPSGALTKIVHNYFVAVARLQDEMGVTIITDR